MSPRVSHSYFQARPFAPSEHMMEAIFFDFTYPASHVTGTGFQGSVLANLARIATSISFYAHVHGFLWGRHFLHSPVLPDDPPEGLLVAATLVDDLVELASVLTVVDGLVVVFVEEVDGLGPREIVVLFGATVTVTVVTTGSGSGPRVIAPNAPPINTSPGRTVVKCMAPAWMKGVVRSQNSGVQGCPRMLDSVSIKHQNDSASGSGQQLLFLIAQE